MTTEEENRSAGVSLQISHRDRIEAERFIAQVIKMTDAAPEGLDLFTFRIEDPSPGLIALMQGTARDLEREVVDEADVTRRLLYIFEQTGMSKPGIARELRVPESNVWRWIDTKHVGAPGYKHLKRIDGMMKRLGIPGSVLDDSCCQPMTVQLPERIQLGLPPRHASDDDPVPLIITLTKDAIALLKQRSPDPP